MDARFTRRSHTHFGATIALALALTLALAGSSVAATAVPLGTADSFAVLAGSGIFNLGSTTISGDIGLCCSTTATSGFGPGANSVTQTSGATYIGTGSPAAGAQNDLDTAYSFAAGEALTNTVGVDLSLSDPLLPGVYQSPGRGAFQINTGLTLDFQGDPNAVFVFQGTSITTAAGAPGSVTIINGGATPSTCNIYWQLSDATLGVTLGAGSALKGTTLALGASTLATGATVEGRILTRRSKAVTLDTNTITRTACAAAAPSGGGGGGGGGPTVTPPADTATPTPTPTPTDTAPPADAPPAPPPVALPVVATPRSPLSGTARLSAPGRSVSGPFPVSVTGRAIASVAFYVDNRRIGTVHAIPGRTKFSVTINPRGQTRRVHRVTARVTFTPRSRTASTSLRTTYRRVVTGPRGPRFTG